jgi:hypothetical protein
MNFSSNVQSLVNRRGQTATLRKKSSGTYDPTTGSLGSVTNTDYTIKAYFAEYSLSEINNDSILMGDRKVLIAPKDTSGNLVPEPDHEDQILGVGDTVVIKRVQSIYNSDTLVCYICQVRE